MHIIRAVIAAWLHVFHTNRHGVRITSLPRAEVQSALRSSKDWIPRYIRKYIYRTVYVHDQSTFISDPLILNVINVIVLHHERVTC